MNFEFSAEQIELREHLAGMLEKSCPLEQVASCFAGDAELGAALWQQLAELGFLGLAIPEELGGGGLSRLEQCVLAEELGRVVAPVPSVGSLYMCAELLRSCAGEEQLRRLLPELAAGALVGAFAGHEGLRDPLQATTAVDTAERIIGEKWPTIDFAGATHVMLTARDEAGTLGLYVVAVEGGKLSPTKLDSFDPSRPLHRLGFESASAEKLERFSPTNFARALENAAVFVAFEQLGLAQAALQTGIDYALQRRAFGRVIGSYQAVKHRLVDMYGRIELARTHAYYAAWAIEHQNAELAAASRLALVACNEAANFAARENIIVHGGIGFTVESPCHLFLKRAQQTATLLGSGAALKQKILSDMLTTARAGGASDGLR